VYTHQPAPLLQAQSRRIVILPLGSCEQHGPYLPIDTDLRIAQLLAERLATTLADDALLLPILPFSCSWEHRGLGTIALSVSTLAAVVHDIACSLNLWNTPFLFILVNWHGGNDLLGALATEITALEGIPTAAIPSAAQVGKAWDVSGMTTAKDIHAGAVETAILRAYWPGLVQPIPETAHCEPDIVPAKVQLVLQSIGSYASTTHGIWGAPEDADTGRAIELIEKLTREMHQQTVRLLELVNAKNV
jgi:creatinine amidohydrolase/Fe(II)-dependent formamide hydrolase-like protein